jgi:hypothetical protein
MNQQQFNDDLNRDSRMDEWWFDFRDNPIRRLFDQPPKGQYERSYLDADQEKENHHRH